MVVLAIDESYADRLAAEALGCIQTTKAPADDHDMRYLLVRHVYLITIVVFGLITFPRHTSSLRSGLAGSLGSILLP